MLLTRFAHGPGETTGEECCCLNAGSGRVRDHAIGPKRGFQVLQPAGQDRPFPP